MDLSMMTEPTEDTPLKGSGHLESKKRLEARNDENVS
jgi:hypothetical protein